MGANRKLQLEIDRTLKKVAEGIEVFDQIWDKVYEADNPSQKVKFEEDLKKEIKKLQRFRDQIKTWISGTDIKDKADLIEARKKVERQMERFKVCEKEMKTKAFSKEGLGQAAKLDPKEKAKNEMRDWINDTVDKLTTENEAFDAEMEGLAPAKGKKGKPPPRHAHLEESIVRHKAHITRLEQMLRLLDNEALGVDDMAGVKELVEDYIDRNQESFDEFENPDDIYSDILEELDGLEAQLPAAMAVTHVKIKDPKDKEKEKEKERERERQLERERAAAQAAKQQLAAQAGINVKMEEEASPAKPAELLRKSSDANAKAAHVKEPATPTGRAAVAVTASGKAAADGPGAATPTTPARAQQPFPGQPPSPMAARQDQSLPSSRHTSMEGRKDQREELPPAGPQPPPPPPPPITAPWAFAGDSEAFPQLGHAPPPQQDGQKRPAMQQPQRGNAAAPPPPNAPAPDAKAAAPTGRTAEGEDHVEDVQQAPAAAKEEAKGQQVPLLPPGQLGDLLGPYAARAATPGGLAGVGPIPHPQDTLKLLTAAYARAQPQPMDGVWQSVPPRMRVFPNGVPPSYPSVKMPVVENPMLFEKLDTESLFFAFYYQPGTYQQYLAARELKRQSWRYHKQHAAWFQRHEEPKTANDEYEQGTYVYFDYNIIHDDQQTGWCYRLKQDFMFKYDALEDELRTD